MRHRLWLLTLAFLVTPALAHADAFDRYTNDLLVKIPTADGVQQVKELTPELLVDHNRVLPDIKGAFLVVRTNEGRYCKLLAHAARQKVGEKSSLPILLIDRFVTYKEGEERTVIAEGKNLRLFQDFHLNLDLGQIVPTKVGGDIRLIVNGDKIYAEPIGNADLWLVTKPLAEATPKKAEKVIVGPIFEPKYFDGSYNLYDDGRRSGKLVLKISSPVPVLAAGTVGMVGSLPGTAPLLTAATLFPGRSATGVGYVDGWLYSDKDGAKYDVTGKVGEPSHTVKFKVHFPRTVVEYQGWMFTGDGRAICGVSGIQGRESGFYAVRSDKE